MSDWIKELDSIVQVNGLRFTFSINCHSGIASLISKDHKCGCKRCRTERGEQWTEETEAQAAEDSNRAQIQMRKWARAMYCENAVREGGYYERSSDGMLEEAKQLREGKA